MSIHSALVVAFFLTLFLPAQGQITKGSTIQFGLGDISLNITSSSSSLGDSDMSFDPDLSYGLLYLVSDHWAIGGSLGTFSVSNLNSGDNGIMPVARYYLNPKSTTLNWYTTTGLGVAIGSDTRLDQWIVGVGFNRFLNKNVLLETGLNVSFQNQAGPLLDRPMYNLGLGLLVYLSKENRQNKKLTVPAIGKGSWLVGANDAAIAYRPIGDDFTFSFSLQPNVGYFFTDRWLGGIGINIRRTATRLNSEFPSNLIDYANLTLGANVFTRYYFEDTENRLRPFGHLQLGFVHASDRFMEAPQIDLSGNSTWFTTRFGAGANLFLGPRVALEGAVTYVTGGGSVVINNTSYQLQRLGLDLGFQFFFGGAKE